MGIIAALSCSTRSYKYRKLEKVTRNLSNTLVQNGYVPEKRVLWRHIFYLIFLYLLWKAIDQIQHQPISTVYTCGPLTHFHSPRMQSFFARRYLVGRLRALAKGYQLGNQVFEILGFEAIARTLGRIPVIVLDDEYNVETAPQLWSAATYFPRLLEGYRFWRIPHFNWTEYPTGALVDQYNTFHNLTDLEEFSPNETVTVDAAYFENYKYMDILGKPLVKKRLSLPRVAFDFAYELVDEAFHNHTNRLCIHMRRGDYTVNPVLIASNSSYTVRAVEKIIELNGGGDFGVIIFTDGTEYLKKMMAENPFEGLPVTPYVPFSGPRKDYVPKHYTWLFLQNFCTHILLTAGRSTFGFFGAYLSPETTKVYYNPYHTEETAYDLPLEWIPIDGLNQVNSSITSE